MREYLFRAYDKTTKRYRKFDGQHDTMTINEDGKIEYYNLQNGSGGDEYILEQFTGLHDSTTWKELTEQERKDWTMKGHMPSEWRGKKIFEGDIVVLSDDTVLPGYRYAISFHDGAFCVGLHDGELFGDFCSIRDGMAQARKYDKEFSICVIGNIHDQKEK